MTCKQMKMSFTGCVCHSMDRSDFNSGIIRPPIGAVLKGFHHQSASFCETRKMLAAYKATEEDEKEENLEAAAKLLLSDLDVIFVDLIDQKYNSSARYS